MNNTIGEIVSRVRNLIKGVRHDAFLTDRFLFSMISKHAKWLIKREDGQFKIASNSTCYAPLSYVELIEVDTVEAQCTGIKSGIKIMRTKDKLPPIMTGYLGPLIRNIGSLDTPAFGSRVNLLRSGLEYRSIKSSKNSVYNPSKYCWYLNGHLYLPDIMWDSLYLEVVPEAGLEKYNCPVDCDSGCKTRQEQIFYFPEYLYAELESNVMKELGFMLQVPPDLIHDNQNITK